MLARLCCLLPATSVLFGLATFNRHFTTWFLSLFIELVDRRSATLCSASSCLVEYVKMRGPCFQVLCGWTLLGVDVICRHSPVPQAVIRFGDFLTKNR